MSKKIYIGNAPIKGSDGKSAYQSWLDQGNIGTEAEFVESLKANVKANEEDIDFDSSDKLQLADRVYNTSTPDGLGYVILRKNKTFAQQVTQENTIYEVRYNYNLFEDFTIPNNCVLDFRGGSIDGAFTLDLNNCQILGTNEWIGTSLTISGKTSSPCMADWFKGTDSDKIERAISFFSVVGLNARTYTITRTINVLHSCRVYGYGMPDFFGDYTSPASDLSQTYLVTTMESGTMFNIRGKVQSNNISAFGSFVFEGIGFSGNKRKCDALTFTSYAGPSRPCVIQKCTFKRCNKGISFDTTAYDSSTTGTGTGSIDIRNCSIAYCNYGIYGAGRTVVGRISIVDNVIEQCVICGIKCHQDQSYNDVSATSFRLISNLLEGQAEVLDLKCNGAAIEIAYNGFEYASGQNIRIINSSLAAIKIIGNRMSSANPLKFFLTGCIVYASSNIRSIATTTNMQLHLSGSHIVETDLPIFSLLGMCTANMADPTKKDAVKIGRTNFVLDSFVDGKFCMKVPDDNNYVSGSIGAFTLEANVNYVVAFGIKLPKDVASSKTYVIVSGFGYEGQIPSAIYRENEHLIVMIGKMDTTAIGLKNVVLRVKNNASGVPFYITDAVLCSSVPDQIPLPIYDTKNVNQPTLTEDDAGATYFDRTLQKQIVWNGTTWVNMDGSTLS